MDVIDGKTAKLYVEGTLPPGLELDVVWRKCRDCGNWWAYPFVGGPDACAPCLLDRIEDARRR